MRWHRVRAGDKTAWREDLQEDTTLTDLQKRMISVIAKHWDNSKMHSECSGSFIAIGAGTTEKMVKRYKQAMIDSGRVSVKRKPDYTSSTLWDVNWWFRGSAWVRHTNGGKPILDCRKGGPQQCADVVPNSAQGVVPNSAQGVVPKQGPNSYLKVEIGAPKGARPFEGARGAPGDEKKENPRAAPGFAKWRIVHAEYEGDDGDMFVAHLRSGKNRKFVLRCDIDSNDYDAIDSALNIGGEPENVVGEMVLMSTNRTGPKSFLRAGPLPWVDVTILSGEEREEGGAAIRVAFHDSHGGESTIALSAEDAASLIALCGGEGEAIGARVRYRLLPDDTFEFRLVEAATEPAA